MMTTSRALLSVNLDPSLNDPLRELFEACKSGDTVKVKKLITSQTVNARDTAGNRKSTPLHFAAGKQYFDVLESTRTHFQLERKQEKKISNWVIDRLWTS